MKSIGIQSRVASFGIAVVLLAPISPALAGGPPDAQIATIQGTRFPGMTVPSTDTAKNKRRGPVDIPFTKWVVPAPPPPAPQPAVFLLGGFTGGDVVGDFVGEVLQRQVSLDGRVIRLEAVYEVQAGNRSFTALIRGGQTGDTPASGGAPATLGAGLLDGVILAGWRTGAKVHVAFQKISSCLDRDGVTHGPCLEGTIRIERAPED